MRGDCLSGIYPCHASLIQCIAYRAEAVPRVNPLTIHREITLANALVQLVAIEQEGASSDHYARDGVYWVDMCITPRRPDTRGRYIDWWGPHRYSAVGPVFALPPGQRLHLRTEGGGHSSVVCQIEERSVERWLPSGFAWTDRRREVCLDLAGATLRDLMLRLSVELSRPRADSTALAEALVAQLAIELARYLAAIDEPGEKGGLADWRLRLIESRLAEVAAPASLAELAARCDVSVRQLTRGFRASRGCSIGDFMANSRTELAKRLLAGDQSIKAIASAMGFASQSNFTSFFRRTTGATPAEYRTVVRLGSMRVP